MIQKCGVTKQNVGDVSKNEDANQLEWRCKRTNMGRSAQCRCNDSSETKYDMATTIMLVTGYENNQQNDGIMGIFFGLKSSIEATLGID